MLENGLLFALISLAFAGVNDFIFKKHSLQGDGRGPFMAIVGLTWMLLFAGLALLQGQHFISREVIGWGLTAGFLSAAANYLLLQSFRHLNAGTGATIYRLNMVAAIVLAVLLLHEQLTPAKVAGTALAVAAVLLFGGQEKKGSSWLGSAFLLALTASFLRALMGIGYKLAAVDFAALPTGPGYVQENWFLSFQGLVWLLAGMVVGKCERSPGLTAVDMRYGLISGLLISGIVLFFNEALAVGQASIIIPVSQMSFLVTAMLSGLLINERFSPGKMTALLLSAGAIVILSLSA